MIRNRDLMDRLEHIYTALVVGQPGTPLAVEAYDGLRRSVINSFNATQQLYAAVAQLDQLAEVTEDVSLIRAKLNELMQQLQLHKVTEYREAPNAFERIGPGPHFKVTKPAYLSGHADLPPVLMGTAEGDAGSSQEPPAVLTPEEDPADDITTAESDTIGEPA